MKSSNLHPDAVIRMIHPARIERVVVIPNPFSDLPEAVVDLTVVSRRAPSSWSHDVAPRGVERVELPVPLTSFTRCTHVGKRYWVPAIHRLVFVYSALPCAHGFVCDPDGPAGPLDHGFALRVCELIAGSS